MAWSFDGTNDNVTLADHAILDLPDGDWTIAVILKLASTTGWPNDRGVFYREDTGGQGAIEVEIDQTGGNASFQKLEVYDDSFADEVVLNSNPTAPWSSNTNWTQLIVKRSGTNYIVKVGGSEVLNSGGLSNVTLGEDWTGVFEIGATGGNEFFHGLMAEMACWFRSLSDAEEAALWNGTTGFSPAFFQNSLQWYLPMIRDYIEVKAGLAVTNNGSTVVAHPPIIYPASPYIIRVPAAPAGEEHQFAGSAEVSFDGSLNTLLREQVFKGSDTVSMDGSLNTLLREQVFKGSESLTFDGTATLNKVAQFGDSAALTFDGSLATVLREQVFRGQGDLDFDGSASLLRQHAFAGSGALTFDGSILFGGTVEFAGSGALSFGGSATLDAYEWVNADTATEIIWSDID